MPLPNCGTTGTSIPILHAKNDRYRHGTSASTRPMRHRKPSDTGYPRSGCQCLRRIAETLKHGFHALSVGIAVLRLDVVQPKATARRSVPATFRDGREFATANRPTTWRLPRANNNQRGSVLQTMHRALLKKSLLQPVRFFRQAPVISGMLADGYLFVHLWAPITPPKRELATLGIIRAKAVLNNIYERPPL